MTADDCILCDTFKDLTADQKAEAMVIAYVLGHFAGSNDVEVDKGLCETHATSSVVVKAMLGALYDRAKAKAGTP